MMASSLTFRAAVTPAKMFAPKTAVSFSAKVRVAVDHNPLRNEHRARIVG
jgi:hypothetical protein